MSNTRTIDPLALDSGANTARSLYKLVKRPTNPGSSNERSLTSEEFAYFQPDYVSDYIPSPQIFSTPEIHHENDSPANDLENFPE